MDDYIKILYYSNVGLVERLVPKIYYYNKTIELNYYNYFEYTICRITELDESHIFPKILEKIEAIKVINNFKLVAIFRRKELK
jgi:hypothetical protein